ncbi:IS3 family transposase [Streptomyces sp. NPDC059454]|uniref:IS3 family transposase n=1 Tax=Streptomyces sp. NPDC059454 TaxID=3346836 RepID=UPI00368629DE
MARPSSCGGAGPDRCGLRGKRIKGRKRVERLMREAGLAGISPRRTGKGFTRRDRDAELAPDLVQRDFTADRSNRLWVTDLTMIPTGEGPLWLSAIRDALSRRVVSWETAAHADADLVLTTREYALASREAEPGQLIHHADHGCQYTSVKLTTRPARAGVEASMGSVGDSYDNALAKNLWMLIKTEGLRGRTFATRAEANLALFEYIDGPCCPIDLMLRGRGRPVAKYGCKRVGFRSTRHRGGSG